MTIEELKTSIRNDIISLLTDEARKIFEETKIISFGWSQYYAGKDKWYDIRHTLLTPDINGSVGELIYEGTPLKEVQNIIINLLRNIGGELLFFAFGLNNNICFYDDGSYEIDPIII